METSSVNQHDVFIHFSLEEFRYSFASHLSAAFSRSSISVFVAEDTSGAAVTPNTDFQLPDATQSAIEGTKFIVVVFSKNDAFSPLFLETLVKFLERRKDGLVVVIPVFYADVTLSMIERKMESFGEAFPDHLVGRWRNGLIEAANLRGHKSSDQRNDSELVDEIVADVREKMYPTGKIGFYSRFLGIENLLRKQSHDIYRLGVWGTPGVGKTTIAQTAFNLMSQDFETHCFIEDFHIKFQEKGLYKLKEEHFIEKLRKKTVLIVLDDVRNPMDVESFLGGYDCFGLASLIIITSRDKQVLYQCQVEGLYEVTSLNKKEGLQLFNQFAFPEKEPSDSNLVEVSKMVVEYANGNRAALCSYGRELKGMTKPEEMEVEFQRIKRHPPQEIMNVFKSSYDTLTDHERNIFLDIACFFKDEQLDYILRILEGCGFFPHVGVDRLVDRSLLMISENKKVKMHNLIQDVGRKIAKTECSHIARMWEPSSIKSLLEDSEPKETEFIEGIFLDTTNINVVVNPNAFENMYNLRLLKIYSSSSEPSQELYLPKGLESLPYELKLLHWEYYPLQSLPQDFDPSHLVEINMPYSQLQYLWTGTKSLAKLKIINLSHSRQLIEVDELSKACSLQEIVLKGCTIMERTPRIDNLKNLKLLDLSCCMRIKRAEVIEMIKVPELEGGLRETESESMVFTT
ncbi:unnamed protein product [Eruca vesicaria subsp. sativa]|uniref:TIR domain-containing protein n=1 Tax=Eruca vesicaria subsp. sativa TaxID=29727 RepID=A0ABC8JTD8_ERUVS|nr:unnamed protein product [Eruca vesicaria subsp. sativa]